MHESLSLLISTLNDGIYRCKAFLEIEVDEIILVHQITIFEKKETYLQFHKEFREKHIKIIPCYEAGLSKSRNICLLHGTSELLLICDDDCIYQDNLKKRINSFICHYPTIDIYTFEIESSTDIPFKKYANKNYRHTKYSVAKVSSIEILIRKSWFQKSKLQFDEQFGLGTSLPSGEEYVFLTDALKRNAHVHFIPEYIVKHPPLSTGKNYSKALIISKGAMFKRTFGFLFVFFNFFFAVKKYPEYKSSFSFFQFLQLIYSGSKYKVE